VVSRTALGQPDKRIAQLGATVLTVLFGKYLLMQYQIGGGLPPSARNGSSQKRANKLTIFLQ
jgi:hypothetical protein